MPSKEKTGLIAAIGVDKSAIGKGVGLALMVKAMENMRERGIEGFASTLPFEIFMRNLDSRSFGNMKGINGEAIGDQPHGQPQAT
jgi:beta-N-acetylhexosaminidase